MVKSPSLSTISTFSRWKQKLFKHVRPRSLDLTYTYTEDEAYAKSSTDTIQDSSIAEAFVANELPLPPRCPKKRPLRGTKPPPRHLLGPKPDKLLIDSKLNTDDKSGKTEFSNNKEMELEAFTDYKDPELYADKNKVENNEPQDVDSEAEIDDGAATDYTNLDEMNKNRLCVPNSKLDGSDIISESSADTTVVTAIEMNGQMHLLHTHATVSRETSKSIVSSDSIFNTPVSTASNKSVFDYTKLSKDIQNKMSKESSQRIANNLAAEISNFFRISASKLRPPCLHSRKVTAIEEVVIKRPDNQNKVRLIPRSPYIAPVKFDHIVHRTQPKQTPFWDVNNTASLTYSKSLSPINWCDAKAMKNLENAARKKLLIRDGDNSEPITRSEKKAYANRTHTLITRSEQHTHTLMARDLKLKSRLYLSMSDKIVTKLPTDSPDNSYVSNEKLQGCMSPESLITRYSDYRLAVTNPSKVIIPPAPPVTLKKIKTQLPCDFPKGEKLYRSMNNSMDLSADKSSLILKESRTNARFARRQQKRYNNEHHHNIDEFADMVLNPKPDNTWPPKNRRSRKKKVK